jgi:sugar lactone lactonase YvrE
MKNGDWFMVDRADNGWILSTYVGGKNVKSIYDTYGDLMERIRDLALPDVP